jgi:hypothetical protein
MLYVDGALKVLKVALAVDAPGLAERAEVLGKGTDGTLHYTECLSAPKSFRFLDNEDGCISYYCRL